MKSKGGVGKGKGINRWERLNGNGKTSKSRRDNLGSKKGAKSKSSHVVHLEINGGKDRYKKGFLHTPIKTRFA